MHVSAIREARGLILDSDSAHLTIYDCLGISSHQRMEPVVDPKRNTLSRPLSVCFFAIEIHPILSLRSEDSHHAISKMETMKNDPDLHTECGITVPRCRHLRSRSHLLNTTSLLTAGDLMLHNIHPFSPLAIPIIPTLVTWNGGVFWWRASMSVSRLRALCRRNPFYIVHVDNEIGGLGVEIKV